MQSWLQLFFRSYNKLYRFILWLFIILITGVVITEITVRLTAYPENKISQEAKADIEKTNQVLVMCRGAPIGNLLFWRKKLENIGKTIDQGAVSIFDPKHKDIFAKSHDITYSFYGLFGIKGEEIIYYANYRCKQTGYSK
jgi:hypothetical protein